jgi:hypothetical protein
MNNIGPDLSVKFKNAAIEVGNELKSELNLNSPKYRLIEEVTRKAVSSSVRFILMKCNANKHGYITLERLIDGIDFALNDVLPEDLTEQEFENFCKGINNADNPLYMYRMKMIERVTVIHRSFLH